MTGERRIHSRSRRLAALAVGSSAAAVASLPLVFGTAHAAETAVDIRSLSFVPEEITIKVGDTVTWTNFDSDKHDIQGDQGMDSPELEKDQTYSFTYPEMGDLSYQCTIHTYMRGRIIVSGPNGETPPTTSEPPPVSTTSSTTTTTTTPLSPVVDLVPTPGGQGLNRSGGAR